MPYLGDILPEDSDATFDPSADILEIIGDEQPGGGDVFSLENGEATLIYLIDWKKARSFLRSCLGFSYADQGAPYALRRENPWYHPRFPWLTAGTVSFSSIAPLSNPDSGVPADAPNFPAVFLVTPPSKTALYQKCYCTVRFVHRPWTFRSDAAITGYQDELSRNVYVDPSPSVEMLSAEGSLGQMKWAETGAGGPTVGKPIPTPFGTLVCKTTYLLNWMWCPESYLSNDPLFFNPSKLITRMGKVNNTAFGSWPTGTVLMMPPKFQRFLFPVSTFDGLYPFYGWNISIPLVFFQPRPRGAAAPADDGYRLLPWSPNLQWYSAKRNDNATYLYQEDNLLKIFQHIDDPT